MNKYIEQLNTILESNNVCKSHGIEHAIAVMNNAQEALKYCHVDNKATKNVLLAALLHDADDYKFFKNNDTYHNVKTIMTACKDSEEDINQVIHMIDIVSSSKNGDSIPDNIQEWMLIPRYADRIEAIGKIGIIRCYKYIQTQNQPYYTNDTFIPTCEEDIYNVATLERYNNYSGNSVSMIDHYYDKLIRLSIFPIRNEFFDKECEIRRRPIIDFLLYFGKCMIEKGSFTDIDINQFIDV